MSLLKSKSSDDSCKRIVITGASRGLGRALTDYFIDHGHRVWGCGTNVQTITKLQISTPRTALFSVVDLTDGKKVERWAEKILSSGIPPDLLINCAGILTDKKPFSEIDSDEFERAVQVNLMGPARIVRALLPAMMAKKKGTVVFMASSPQPFPLTGLSPYCTTKTALERLVQCLAEELPEEMAAVALYPGLINTDMLKQSLGESAEDYESSSSWVQRAGPFIENLEASSNGKHLWVPPA